MKRSIFRKQLSTPYMVKTLLVNGLIFCGVFLFFGFFFKMTGSHRVNIDLTGVFTLREVILCCLLSMILCAFWDYKYLIHPIQEMEELIDDFIENSQKNKDILQPDNMNDLSFAEVMKYLLKQQQLSDEQKRIEEIKRKRTEIYALQTQIDPHFLYNALDSIRGYALLHDMDEISDITEALSRVFRNMISNKQKMIPLYQEIDNIQNYLKIQQFRFNNKFTCKFEIEEEILERYMIPRMILQPLVENSIVHGLEQTLNGGWVKIRAHVTEHRLIVSVTDNGMGMSKDRLELLQRMLQNDNHDFWESNNSNSTGIALININRRIRLDYGKQFGITLYSTPNVRTSVEVELPLMINKNEGIA